MKVELQVVGCKVDRENVSLALPATIGRGTSADLVIAHREVSRKHCRLFVYKDLVHVQDLQSMNGTYVNGHHLQNAEMVIMPGERFSVGPVTFEIQYHKAELTPSTNGSTARRVVRPGSSHVLAAAVRSGSSSREQSLESANALTEKAEE
ncbi:MAG: FHA domain-containing protein [Planctomycetia bacterium]|nr:FHA domain-containing protein [Planctomycetia bacterium]